MTEQPITNRRRVLVAFLSNITCGEACWHAKDEVCRCSCGGENHGCLLDGSGERPVRSAKIGGFQYELAAVGTYRELIPEAQAINAAHYPASSDPMKVDGVVVQRYHYRHTETEDGSPARLKPATHPQIGKWPELRAWLEKTEKPYLLWKRVDAPPPRYCPDDGCEKCNELKAQRVAK